ncbi:MAG TPA: N-acetylglucosamine-6-phosphate deacetylase [Egibacteraceae bacterium]|nr:N-acetylglucosamine-6-phosphate deacetylase [Egibacteraceae bacterium]
MSILLTGGAVVTPQQTLRSGWVLIRDGVIAEVGGGAPPPGVTAARDLGGSWVVPGFIDIHTHGGGGAWLSSPDSDEVRRAARFHLEHGTTRLLASIATAPEEQMLAAAATVADLIAEGDAAAAPLVGIHFEGPFLSPARCGAQDPSALQTPDVALLDRLLAAGRGTVRTITIAPELPGGMDLVRRAVAAGVIPAVGHTDGAYADAIEAIDAGARLATHLFNAMPPLHHRSPGPIAALLHRREVVCEVVCDGVHLDPAIVRLIFASVGSARVALITDAIAAAGVGDGDYQFGRLRVTVEDGHARLAGGGAIAGSTLTMDAAFRRAVTEVGLSVEDAVVAASSTPARLLGLERAGSIAPGNDADLVILDDGLRVSGVLCRGAWV